MKIPAFPRGETVLHFNENPSHSAFYKTLHREALRPVANHSRIFVWLWKMFDQMSSLRS